MLWASGDVLYQAVALRSVLLIIFCVCVSSCCFPDAEERSAKRFSVDGVFNYTSLLLSQEDDTLYVGAREALFALSLLDISKTKLQKNVSVCLETGPSWRLEISLKNTLCGE